MSFVDSFNPDIILMENADIAARMMFEKCREYGINFTLSRGKFRFLKESSYYSYGAVKHRRSALITEGKILIDTASFAFREYGLKGILFTSRLTGLSANLTSRFTPRTLISSYEVYEALRRGIAVPFRKRDAEKPRRIEELRRNDKGGLILQPEPGVYENVSQIDFTSMYPAIIVKYNLSPESIGNGRKGFLSTILEPLLELRIKTKRMKKTNPEVAGIDSALKWMLVTCFGYTGFKNAKFGSISVHERITGIGREILLESIRIAEESGTEVIHAMVDSVFVRNSNGDLKERIERETGLLAEEGQVPLGCFPAEKGWIWKCCPLLRPVESGEMKLRGVMARRRDTPEFIRRAQMEMFYLLRNARTLNELAELESDLKGIYRRYMLAMKYADPEWFFIRKRISRTSYSKNSLEASAVRELKKLGVKLFPGMEIEYVVVDFKRKLVSIRNPETVDFEYYRKLLEKAYEEVSFAVRNALSSL
ncbi:type B DNA-directed DNA polymerase [Archaeoglobus sulfaticallidus]|uniref:type B DNA-directed DNA polymerase n=1 Tax=Archaeoglobus sulfaticallidus TaxID=1316941 RepID=UPI00064E2A34|nr:type B DNA-directed DNA polymerase [Archaeoglobus sulfaticallidus]